MENWAAQQLTIWRGSLKSKSSTPSAHDIICREIEKEMYRFFSETAIANGYTEREKQYDMAEEILETFKKGEHLMVEAGVGIGKTFAYLVPALLYHKRTGSPIIIATSTIALQEQLKADVETVAEMLDIPVEPIVAKGQTNYLCKKKARMYKGPHKEEIKQAVKNGYAERADFSSGLPDSVWDEVKVTKYGSRCRRNCDEDCPYKEMRQNLPTAEVTICNQNLLAVSIKQMSQGFASILNKDDNRIVIIDEAHNLEEKTRETLQTTISERSLKGCVKAAASGIHGFEAERAQEEMKKTLDAISIFFKEIKFQMRKQDKAARLKTHSDIIRYYFKNQNDVLSLLYERIKSYYSTIDLIVSNFDNYDYQATEELEETKNSLYELLNDYDAHVVWIEKDGSFNFCKEDIASVAKEMYFSSKLVRLVKQGFLKGGYPIFILTSATMTGKATGTIAEQYDYVAKGIGFDRNFSEPKESPFDYDNHAMTFISDGLPHPTKAHESFIEKGTALLKKILEISEGRALVLFTSKQDMNDVYRKLKGSPFKVLMQQAGSSQQEVLDMFKEDEHAVLLGTGAYWEGINVEGQSLSNLVIFRLPFPVPDPIIDAKEARVKEQGGDPLMEVKVPEMIIKLKQGVGRLIRSETDSGIISIIDSRAGESSHAPYKEMIREALPVKNVTNSLKELKRFYNEHVVPSRT